MENIKNTAAIFKLGYCKDCGWSIIQIMLNGHKEYGDLQRYEGHNYWAYCSNLLCKNHGGEGWGDKDPSFIKRIA